MMNTTDTDFLSEDYVSFEIADLMRMKGFPQKRENSGYYATEMVYGITEQDDGTHHLCHQYPACYHFDDHICAPTLQMAMKWLRLVHNILIVINGNPSDSLLYISIYKKDPYYDEWVPAESDTSLVYTGETIYEKNFKKYEDACEAAIKHCLTKII